MRGGKLPGLAGGNANTGGHKPNGQDGWSARMMWRPDGKIVQYVYQPDQPGNYGVDYPWDFGGYPRYFTPGQWYCVETYVQMNSPGKKDGVIRSWLNGEKALEVKNLRFRDIPSLQIDKMYFSTFFGGADATWAPPADCYADFGKFVISKNYIGPDPSVPGLIPTPTPYEPALRGMLVYDGEHRAWIPSAWSQGTYSLFSNAQNHTPGGSHSVYVQLPDQAWGGVQWEGPNLKVGDYRLLSFWVYPTGRDVEFRVRFEAQGKQTGIEKEVTGALGLQLNQWNHVVLSLSGFKIPGEFNRIVFTSNSPHAVSPFYVDDLLVGK
jgi:hypothetical protein